MQKERCKTIISPPPQKNAFQLVVSHHEGQKLLAQKVHFSTYTHSHSIKKKPRERDTHNLYKSVSNWRRKNNNRNKFGRTENQFFLLGLASPMILRFKNQTKLTFLRGGGGGKSLIKMLRKKIFCMIQRISLQFAAPPPPHKVLRIIGRKTRKQKRGNKKKNQIFFHAPPFPTRHKKCDQTEIKKKSQLSDRLLRITRRGGWRNAVCTHIQK